jgi:hypothetical protein
MNTRMGGHAALIRHREIIADPNGNREQRRAAKRFGIVPDQERDDGEGRDEDGEAS